MSSDFNADDIDSLVALFEASDWQEMHLKSGPLEVFLSRDPNSSGPRAAATAPAPAPAAGPAPGAPPAAEGAASAPPAAAAGDSAEAVIPAGMIGIRAPNLGTFYRAPKPGAPVYVEIGQEVEAGTELCLIEVMKLFTSLKAESDCTIREVCTEDGGLVDAGQLLFIVEPA